ncbi:hypothetical protein [Pseudoflavonifractor phocaeensis]|uniref:hypothetical protein n=1 Tax=Pseudoflavonifractor phocaeensis TaxID=1870988 RepID=UPI00195AF87A|nr:hypothetical protein [Pseudoflavonifractor phocaeensis]
MKRSILALALCLVLPLSGCTSLSGSMYTVVEPHVEQPVLGEDSSTIKAGTYSELVNGVLFFVSQGIEEGTIQLTDYTGDVEEDLNRACLEVATDDPLGAYAVDFIKNEYTTIITTYEATITIAYRRSQEQMNSLINITGTSAIETEVAQALAAFQTELAMRVGYFTGDEDTVLGQLRRAYYEDPAAALGMPQCTVNLYPDSGTQRIVELLLTYPQEPAVLQRRSQQLREKADELVEPVGQQIDSRQLSLLLELLLGAVKVDPQGGVTAWDALLGEGANHEGLALAFQLLCDALELDCALVEGTLEGETHFWNQVTYSGAARFVDLSRSLTQLWTPAQLAELGYQWEEQETG